MDLRGRTSVSGNSQWKGETLGGAGLAGVEWMRGRRVQNKVREVREAESKS